MAATTSKNQQETPARNDKHEDDDPMMGVYRPPAAAPHMMLPPPHHMMGHHPIMPYPPPMGYHMGPMPMGYHMMSPYGPPPPPPPPPPMPPMMSPPASASVKRQAARKDDSAPAGAVDGQEGDDKQGGLDLLASLALPSKKPAAEASAAAVKTEEEEEGETPMPPLALPIDPDNPNAAALAIIDKDNKNKKKKSRSEELSPKEKHFIDKVREVDVLCGRGGKSNHHPGNKKYRQVVSEMKRTYQSTGAKTAKTDLSRAIVEHVVAYGGRFIKRDEGTGQYFLLTKAQARRKTSQALRETKELKWTM